MAASYFHAEPLKKDCPIVGLAAVLAGAPDVVIAVGIVLGLARLDEPGVLVRGMVDHEIHDQLDAALVHPREHLLPVRKRAELLHDVLIVADVIAVVVVGRLVDGGQPDDIDARAP